MQAERIISPRQAFTLVELLVVVLVIGLVAALLLPALSRERQKVRRMQCADNLKQLGYAFKVWSFDQGGKATNSITSSVVPATGPACDYFKLMAGQLVTPAHLICPSDSRTAATDFGRGFSNTNISYFINADLHHVGPQMLLAGDRNIQDESIPFRGMIVVTPRDDVSWTRELHNRTGNLLFGDGSVQQVNNFGLSEIVDNASRPNRLALP
jgi:prepilin-type N-terminal cleavage/methylation domain-containing protein/prepilin-type processing-associated H-X9-DG protein